jgi:hypothetical protein
MSMRPSSWGAVVGIVVALAILAVASYMLLDSAGANYKVLVAVWLWLLPVTGVFAGIGYAAGKMTEVIGGAKTSRDEGGLDADTR